MGRRGRPLGPRGECQGAQVKETAPGGGKVPGEPSPTRRPPFLRSFHHRASGQLHRSLRVLVKGCPHRAPLKIPCSVGERRGRNLSSGQTARSLGCQSEGLRRVQRPETGALSPPCFSGPSVLCVLPSPPLPGRSGAGEVYSTASAVRTGREHFPSSWQGLQALH